MKSALTEVNEQTFRETFLSWSQLGKRSNIPSQAEVRLQETMKSGGFVCSERPEAGPSFLRENRRKGGSCVRSKDLFCPQKMESGRERGSLFLDAPGRNARREKPSENAGLTAKAPIERAPRVELVGYCSGESEDYDAEQRGKKRPRAVRGKSHNAVPSQGKGGGAKKECR